jgi:hypothetical protein
VVEEAEEEEGAALFPLRDALHLFHAALTSLDIGTCLKSQSTKIKLTPDAKVHT